MERNKLITNYTPEGKMLTCMRGKLYTFYTVDTDGTVAEVDWENDWLLDGWRDHCIVPKNFHELAKETGCKYDTETFAYIVEQFVQNYLYGDWYKLKDHLPVDGLE